MSIFNPFFKKPKKTMPLECINCKQSKTYIQCADNASKYNRGVITGFSQRIPTYCYFAKRQISQPNSRCLIPMQDDNKLNEAFIAQNKIEPYYCTTENRDAVVCISLSGRKYHTERCTQIKGQKYVTTVSVACRLGYSPCTKCNPPK